MSYTIEKDIPIPPRRGHRRADGDLRWPLSRLQPGESFSVPRGEQTALRQAISPYQKRYGIKLRTRLQADGTLRVWRVDGVDPFS
jgi:hypothetical protein